MVKKALTGRCRVGRKHIRVGTCRVERNTAGIYLEVAGLYLELAGLSLEPYGRSPSFWPQVSKSKLCCPIEKRQKQHQKRLQESKLPSYEPEGGKVTVAHLSGACAEK